MRGPVGQHVAALLIVCASLLLCGGNAVRAEGLPAGPAETLSVTGMNGSTGGYAPNPAYEVPGGGAGFMTRIGHIAGETVGRDDSITHAGLAPYLFHEETMFFGDLRILRTNEGRTGGSTGVGLRHYLLDLDSIVGVAGYYDIDDTRGAKFKQFGLSLEYLSRWFDVRANWYMPVDETERILNTSIIEGSERFVDNFLLFDRKTEFGSAADGVDLLVSTPIPGEIPEAFNWEVSAGAYHFQVPDSDIQKMWGYRLRTDADLFKRILHMFVELTSDDVIDTNVVIGASLNYYHGFENRRRLQDSQFYRMSEWVRRNHTVVTINDFVITEGEVARNPETGDPWFFAHVENIPDVTMSSGIGTVDDPFQFIQEAQAFLQGSDPEIRDNGVIYVHGNSVFNGVDSELVLNADEIILGEGEADEVIQTLPVLGFSDPATLPIVIPDGEVPQLNGATGTAVTANSGNLFSGFDINDPLGHGILIDTQTDGTFRDVTINNAGMDGLFLTGANMGTFRFDRVRISDAAGVGFHVDGGTAAITVDDGDNPTLGIPTITNMQNEAVLIENTLGGFVNLAQTLIIDDGGAGIRLINNIGNVTIGQATLSNTVLSSDPASVGAGLEINGGSGNTTLLNDIMITNPSGPGLLVANLAAVGSVNASGTISINSRNDVGADFSNIDGTVQFSPTSSLAVGAPSANVNPLSPGIRFHNDSSGSVILNDYSVGGSPAEGVLIGGALVNAPGAMFRTIGMGTLSNTAGPAFRVFGEIDRDPTIVDSRGTLVSNTRLGRGIEIQNTSGLIGFAGAVTVNNNADPQSTLAALFINDVTGAVTFGNFTANDGLGGSPDVFEPPPELEPVVDIQNVAAPASVSFADLNILNAVGTDALDVDDTNQFNVVTGVINVNEGQAIEITNTGINVEFASVTSIESPDFGIFVRNSPGSFTIVGDEIALGSGGTISEAGIAGAVFDNTDEVSLNFQDYIGNGVLVPDIAIGGPILLIDGTPISEGGAGAGIVALNMNDSEDDFIFLNQMQIADNEAQGVYTEDVRNVEIEDSTFMDNGARGILGTQQHISLNVFNNPNLLNLAPGETIDDLNPGDEDFESMVYIIERNLFIDTNPVVADDAILIQTVGAAARRSSLELFVLDNTVQSFVRLESGTVRPASLHVDWNGFLAADILRNTINVLDGDGQTGILIETQGLNSSSALNINDNIITGSGDGDGDNLIGIDLNLAGPANVTVAANAINLNSIDDPLAVANNIGMRFRFLDGNKNVDILNNIILLEQGVGGIGISVPIVASPTTARSSFFIQGNQIGNATQVPAQGIVFNNVTGLLSLNGNLNNIVFPMNANALIVPVNNVVGRLLINGQLVTFP